MSAFHRSTMPLSCLSACEIERIHIFEEGSSPTAAMIARAGKWEFREGDSRYVNTHLLLPCPFPRLVGWPFRNPLRKMNWVRKATEREIYNGRLSRHVRVP